MKFQYFIESYCIYVPRSNFISCSLPAGLHFQHFSTSVFLHRKEQGLQHYKPASTDDQIPAGPPLPPPLPVGGNMGIATLITRNCSQVTFLEA